jgi:hypothetical protein
MAYLRVFLKLYLMLYKMPEFLNRVLNNKCLYFNDSKGFRFSVSG